MLARVHCVMLCSLEDDDKSRGLILYLYTVNRLNQDLFGGAWCPKPQITTETTEWIEIDLHRVYVITASGTQGRFGNGQGVEYSEAYLLEYWRPSLGKWVRYRDSRGEEVSYLLSFFKPTYCS